MKINEIARELGMAGIEDALFEARLLVEYFCKIPVSRLIAEPERDFDSPALLEAIALRKTRYPLQYIMGEWEFMGIPFEVSSDVLIPRPDTEVIAEEAIRSLPEGGRVLDLCTGSGCIIASVLTYAKAVTGCAVELYPETASVAAKNLHNAGVYDRCSLIVGDATKDILPAGELFDVIVSNPPYISADEMEGLEPELSYEPRHALTDGGDGLYIIRKIIEIHRKHLTENGVMIIEHGWRQSEEVAKIARSFGMTHEPVMDYGGNIRGARLTLQIGRSAL